jgi:hypothetical protein
LRTSRPVLSDNRRMAVALANAVAKAAGAFIRRYGLTSVADGWEVKAAVCERCHLRVVKCGVSYCGKPFLRQIDRELAVDGCGCPCREKAKTPGEHCPLDGSNLPSLQADGACNCKWCTAGNKNFTTSS